MILLWFVHINHFLIIYDEPVMYHPLSDRVFEDKAFYFVMMWILTTHYMLLRESMDCGV